MKSTKLARLLLLLTGSAVLLSSVVFAAVPPARPEAPQEPGHPAVVEPFAGGGFEPVQVSEAVYYATENSLKGYRCRLKNISGKGIAAIGLTWTATFSNNRAAQVFQTVDTRVHEDIAAAKRFRPAAPGEEREFRSSAAETFTQSVSVARVTLKIDFIEFTDSSTLGAKDSVTYKRLLHDRQGAALYKGWLADVYGGDARNMGSVVEKLLSGELPEGRGFEESSVRQGAAIYRNWLRGVHAASGPGVVGGILGRTG